MKANGLPALALGFVALLVLGPAAARAAEAGATAGYDKGFFIRAPEEPYALSVQGKLQARFAYEGLEGAADELAFSIPRARLKLVGMAFSEALTFELQVDFGKGFVTLKDAYADYAFIPHWLRLRAGQWKRPFSRQQLASSGRQQFVERAITDAFFGAGRDIGVALHNGLDEPFEWALGVFNGNGDRPTFSGAVDLTTGDIGKGGFTNVPDRFHPALVVRAGYSYGGIKGYSESDLEGGPLRFAVAASGLLDLDVDDDGVAQVLGELDAILKVAGFSTTAALYVSASGPELGAASFQALGFHAQAGYVVAGFVEPAVRYSLVAQDGNDNDLHEILGGLSFFFFGHNVKLQIDGGALLTEQAGGDRADWLVRAQLQLAF